MDKKLISHLMPLQPQPQKLGASASTDLLPLSSSEALAVNKHFQAQIQPHSTKDAHMQQQ